MIQVKLSSSLALAALFVFAAAPRGEAQTGVINAGTSLTTVACPARPNEQVLVYDGAGQPTLLKLPAYTPTTLFQGWGKNTIVLKGANGAQWKLVRVSVNVRPPLNNTNLFVFEGHVTTVAACEKRIGPQAPAARVNLVAPPMISVDKEVFGPSDMDEEGDDGAQEGAGEDQVPIVNALTSGVNNMIKGLNSPACCLMPLEHKPNSYLSGQGRFGWGRGGRIHAGVDLYGKIGDKVRAVAPGQVIREPYLFKKNTMAVDVRHEGGFVVRYGEISQRDFGMRLNGPVQRGQQIGSMAKLACCAPMLHLEIYSGASSGPLTLKGVGRYHRRSDLVDPTKYIQKWPLR